MAKRTKVTYSCDRCDADLGDMLPEHDQEAHIIGSFKRTEDGQGPYLLWKDLCTKCRSDVFKFFNPNKEPVVVEDHKHLRTIRYWFFKYLSEEQRVALFDSIGMLKADRIEQSMPHGIQDVLLKRVINS